MGGVSRCLVFVFFVFHHHHHHRRPHVVLDGQPVYLFEHCETVGKHHPIPSEWSGAGVSLLAATTTATAVLV